MPLARLPLLEGRHWQTCSATLQWDIHLAFEPCIHQCKLLCTICIRKCQNNDLFHNFTTLEVWYFQYHFCITSWITSPKQPKVPQSSTSQYFQIIVPRLGCQAAKPFTTSRAKTVRSLIAAKWPLRARHGVRMLCARTNRLTTFYLVTPINQ